MSIALHRFNESFPFNKVESVSMLVVLVLHVLVAAVLLHSTRSPVKIEEDRMMVSLVSPPATAPTTSPAPPTAAPAPTTVPSMPEPVKRVEQSDPAPATKMVQPALPHPVVKPPNKPHPRPVTTRADESPPQSNVSETAIQPAPPSPQADAPMSDTPVHTEISKLVVLELPDADKYYPSFSKRTGEQGQVMVKMTIDQTGNVIESVLVRGSQYPRLDEAGLAISRRYRFKPYLVNGVATKVSTNLVVKFNLKN